MTTLQQHITEAQPVADKRGEVPARPRVLVVEDDVPLLEWMREVLTSLGIEVQPVHDSQLAADLIGKEKFDVIFLDLMMPKVDGFELARRIRWSFWNRQTPVVIVTGREDAKTLRQAFEAGATFFLQKPFNKERLIHLLNSARRSMLQERRSANRISLRAEVVYQVGSRKLTGMSANLSLSGILFEAHNFLQPGDTVRLAFRLAKQQPAIEAKGIVARIDEKQQAGVLFTHMRTEDRKRLRDFLAGQPNAPCWQVVRSLAGVGTRA